MEIRIAMKHELKSLIPLYKEAFKDSKLWKKPNREVLSYLKNIKGQFLIAKDRNKVVGGLLLYIKDMLNGYRITKFRHIVVSKKFRKNGLGSKLLRKAEKIAKKGKIEIYVNGKHKVIQFYKKNDYKVEGRLNSHYDKNTKCYILGKVMKDE